MTNPPNNNDNLLSNPKFTDWVAHPDPDSQAYWEAWLKENPERRGELEKARAFLEGLTFDTNTSEIDSSALLAKIKGEIELSPNQPRVTWPWWGGMAAAIALAVALFFGINWQPNSYAVPYGEIEKITLPDGSHVVLNANSTLRFETPWQAQTPREVWLEGEAFFEVNAQPKTGTAAFVVHTSRGDVNVLGTTFNVKDRKNSFGVVLTEGSVRLSLLPNAQRLEQEVLMQPGDLVRLNLTDHTIAKTQTNTNLYTAWTQRQLVFENTSISYLADVIEDQYGYRVTIANDALLERRLTGTLNNPSLEDLIQAISVAFNIKVEKTSDHSLKISY